jgi:hypothetical protein
MPSSICPPMPSILPTNILLSASWTLMKSTVFFSTTLSLLPCPSRPGTSSVRRSNPSRMACRRFCSVVHPVSSLEWGCLGRAGALAGGEEGGEEGKKNAKRAGGRVCASSRDRMVNAPEAIWFAFFSCSERRGFSSRLSELPFSEFSRLGELPLPAAGEDMNAFWECMVCMTLGAGVTES